MFIKKELSSGNLWLLAVITVLFLITLVNVAGLPLLNSGDDFFLLYILGGGYGMPPSSLLHYDHIWHPLLGGAVSSLFRVCPQVNWYTLLLLLFHLAGSSAILYVLFRKFSRGTAFLLFGILFLFIEARFLLSLNFTHSSLVVAAGGFMLLLHSCQQKYSQRADTIVALCLLLIAGLLRLQVVWMAGFIFTAVSIVCLTRKQFVRYVILFGSIALLLIVLNVVHKNYYRKHIPGWDEHEKSRQTLFVMFNRPRAEVPWQEVFTDSKEREMFSHGLFYDTAYFTTERLKEIGSRTTRKRGLHKSEDRAILYWNFMESRIYLLLLFVLAGMLWLRHSVKKIFRVILVTLPAAGIYLYLFIFLKTNFNLFFGLWLLALLPVCLLLEQDDLRVLPGKKLYLFGLAPVLFLSCWMVTKLYKQNALNRQNHQRFLCAVTELNRHPDKLFLSTDDNFPLDYFYIWDAPQNQPVRNFIYKVWWQIDAYPALYHRFKISNLRDETGTNLSILMLGKDKKAIELYFPKVAVSDPLPQFSCFSVFRIKKIN